MALSGSEKSGVGPMGLPFNRGAIAAKGAAPAVTNRTTTTMYVSGFFVEDTGSIDIRFPFQTKWLTDFRFNH